MSTYQRVQEAACSDLWSMLCKWAGLRPPPTPPPFCNTSALLNKSGCARSFVFPYLSKLRSPIKKIHVLIFIHIANWVGCATRKALLFVMATHCSGAVGFQQLETPTSIKWEKGGRAYLQAHPFFWRFNFARTYMVLYAWNSRHATSATNSSICNS